MLAPSDAMGYDGLNGTVALPGKGGDAVAEVGGSVEKGNWLSGTGVADVG